MNEMTTCQRCGFVGFASEAHTCQRRAPEILTDDELVAIARSKWAERMQVDALEPGDIADMVNALANYRRSAPQVTQTDTSRIQEWLDGTPDVGGGPMPGGGPRDDEIPAEDDPGEAPGPEPGDADRPAGVVLFRRRAGTEDPGGGRK